MITTAELHRAAESQGLRFDQVEKDYVIVWTLAALAKQPDKSNGWFFKGGTCLRHCYYPEFRFSEDIDFSCLPDEGGLESVLAMLEQTARFIEAASGLRMTVKEPLTSARGEQVEIPLQYSRGRVQKAALPVVKIHLTFDEPILTSPERCRVDPPYEEIVPFDIQAYSKLEIIAEKMRALIQQQERWPRPRDLYDLWFMLCHKKEPVSNTVISHLFDQKCAAKQISPDKHRLVSKELKEWNRSAWAHQLSPMMKIAPDYEKVWSDWVEVCTRNWLESR